MKNFSTLKQVIKEIEIKSPLQKKKLKKVKNIKSKDFLKYANEFVSNYNKYLNYNGISFEDAIDGYIKMCNNMLKSQIYFIKNGTYPTNNQNEAYEKIYNNETEMISLVMGLALSQYLWTSHYNMFCHFKDYLNNFKSKEIKYLEIGPGHGLFLNESLALISKKSTVDVIDISPSSIKMSKNIIEYFNPSFNNINYLTKDILKFNTKNKYDFIVAGEILEHLDKPLSFLIKILTLLSENGIAFISTCINCPAIDHIVHFKSIDEVRNFLKESNLLIIDERIHPVEDLEMKEIIEQKITINYSVIVKNNS